MKTRTKAQREKIYELATYKVGSNTDALFMEDKKYCICRALYLISKAGNGNHCHIYEYFPELQLFSPHINIEECYNEYWFETKEERIITLLFMIEMCKK